MKRRAVVQLDRLALFQLAHVVGQVGAASGLEVDALATLRASLSPESVAAAVVDPVQGAGTLADLELIGSRRLIDAAWIDYARAAAAGLLEPRNPPTPAPGKVARLTPRKG